MDKANPAGNNIAPGISIRNGPVEEMDVDGPSRHGQGPNGTIKRKVRNSNGNGNRKNYKEASDDEEDDRPLVGCFTSNSKNQKIGY